MMQNKKFCAEIAHGVSSKNRYVILVFKEFAERLDTIHLYKVSKPAMFNWSPCMLSFKRNRLTIKKDNSSFLLIRCPVLS